jgi:protein-S-isoprenylcysteine O-methyltransferase Ste14
MNVTPEILVTFCWLIFVVIWFLSSFNTKAYAKRNFQSWSVRFVIIVIILVLFDSPGSREYIVATAHAVPLGLQWLGVFFVVCGIGITIWARVYLGRNWGMPMSLKQDAELVTSGPYAYVRHPIYTGWMLAALGSTLVTIWWGIPFIFFFIYFVYSAKAEEKIMLDEFGDKYADYMKRSNMLIPFLF